MKKYLKQNAKVLGFNVDPKFSDALDGLMLLDIFQIPEDTIRSLMKEFNAVEKEAAFKERKQAHLEKENSDSTNEPESISKT